MKFCLLFIALLISALVSRSQAVESMHFKESEALRLVEQNKTINLSNTPVSRLTSEKKMRSSELLFYLLVVLSLVLGIIKTFYSRYFNTIFRVYFKTSLRQNQLTDLLLQAKLPSLVFNIFFFLSAGIYASLVFHFIRARKEDLNFFLIPSIVIALALVYIGKYAALKFIGWITGMKNEADTYLFIVFLINKIFGVLLLPFIILLAFSPIDWKVPIMITSISIVMFLLLSRYFRSYELLQHKLTVSRIHFLLYILAFEIIPILIIGKLFARSFLM